MNQSRLPDYLNHIRQAASDACSFVEGQGKEAFLADRRTQQAVILSLLIIGEAATKLLQGHGEFLTRHPEVPWSSMKGMRTTCLTSDWFVPRGFQGRRKGLGLFRLAGEV